MQANVNRSTMKQMAIKALRILLVFTLAFYGTFRIEMVALAADEGASSPAAPPSDTGGGTGGDAGGGTSGDTGGGTGGDTGGGTEPGGDSGGGTSGESGSGESPSSGSASSGSSESPSSGAAQPATQSKIQKLEVHLVEEHPANPNAAFADVGALVAELNGQTGAISQASKPVIDKPQGTLKFVPVIVQTDGTRVDAKGMVDWDVKPDFQGIADFLPSTDRKSNVLQAKGVSDSEIVATCKLRSDQFSRFDVPAGSTVELTFSVNVIEQSGPYIQAIEILDDKGNAFNPGETLKLKLDNSGHISQQFAARVTVRNPARDADPATYTISAADTSTLSDHDKGLLDSLEWSTSDSDASIDPKTGLFTTSTKLETAVICTSNLGPEGSLVSTSINVNTGIDADIQGASHPQDTLLVIAPSEVVKQPEKASDSTSSESSASPTASASAASPSADATAGDTEATQEPEPQPEPINRAYSLGELSSLGWTNVTYTFLGATPGASGENASGGSASATGAPSGTTTITGEGPSLVALLEDAGVDLQKVKSVTFVNYLGETQTISWSSIGAEGTGAILAANSLVHVDGEDTTSLLKNTRFRLLIGDNVSLDSALRWINTIRVNGEGEGQGGGGMSSEGLQAVIGYVPVAAGKTAVLTASVVGVFQGERFGFEWQESFDGGVTWSSAGKSQTLRVPTSAATIGRMYRVVATTVNGRKAESSPVTITENTGFSVTLAYDPPIAGGMAFFATSVTGVKASEITDYIWEFTTDGGSSWQEIAGSRGRPTFSAQTNGASSGGGSEAATPEPSETASDSGSAASSESTPSEVDTTPAPIMWVHVRVLATEGREAVSNPVMITAHTSEDGGAGESVADLVEDIPDDENNAPGDDNTIVTPTDEQSSGSAAAPSANTSDTQPPSSAPVVHEVTSITTETSPRSQSQSQTVASQTPAAEQTPDGTEQTPQPESAQSDALTDLIIDPTVSAEILEQREAAAQTVQSTQPGARWTALATVNPDGKDVDLILQGNPFAPFVAPLALGVTVAGVVEQILAFRRKTH